MGQLSEYRRGGFIRTPLLRAFIVNFVCIVDPAGRNITVNF